MMQVDRPLFRQDLLAEAVDEMGKKFIDVADPDSGRIFRFYESEFALACAMDGQRDVPGIVKWASDELGLKTNPNEVRNVIATLVDHGFLELGRDVVLPQARPVDTQLAPGVIVGAKAAPEASPQFDLGDAGVGRKVAEKPAPKAPDFELAPPGPAAQARTQKAPVEDVSLGPPGPSRTAKPEPSPPISTDISLDLSDEVKLNRNEVKEAIRQSRVMQAVEIPPDLQDALDDKPPPRQQPAAAATKPADKQPPVVEKQPPVVEKQPERTAAKQPAGDKHAERAGQKQPQPQPDNKARPVEKTVEKPADKQAERQPAVDMRGKPAEKAPASERVEKPAERPVERPVEKPAERPVEKQPPVAEKPADKHAEKPTDKGPKPVDKKPHELQKPPADKKPVDKKPVPPEEPKQSNWLLITILLLLVLGAGGFALWKFVLSKSADKQQSGGVVPVPPPQPVATGSAGAGAAGSGGSAAVAVAETPAPKGPVAKFVSETPPERAIMRGDASCMLGADGIPVCDPKTLTNNLHIEWIEQVGKDVKSGDLVAKLTGAANLEMQIKNIETQKERVQRELEAAQKELDNAKAAGNAQGEKLADAKVKNRQESLDKKSEDIEKKKEEMERVRIYARDDGKLTAVAKAGTVVGDNTEIAKIQPANRLVVTFPSETLMDKVAAVVYVKDGGVEKPVTCTVIDSKPGELKIGSCQQGTDIPVVSEGTEARLHLSE